MIAFCSGLVGCARYQFYSKPVPYTPTQEQIAAVQAKRTEDAEIRAMAKTAPQREGSYRINTNDVLQIRVAGTPQWDLTARVAEDGSIRFPPIGVVQVLGRTERELEEEIQDKLKGAEILKQPQVTVFVSETHPRTVYLFGSIASPGEYTLEGGMRFLDLVALGGGISQGAGTSAYVIRPRENGAAPAITEVVEGYTENRITIDLEGLLIKGEMEWNIPLWPGDIVNVPAPDPGWVHVTGPGIKNPGTYPLITLLGLQGTEVSPTGVQNLVPYPLTRSSKSLRQAIDEAGGLKYEASRRILILRESEEGEREYLDVDYRKVLADSRSDVPLQTRDTVVVKYNPTRWVVGSFVRLVQEIVRVGVSLTYDLNDNSRGSSGGGNVTFIN